MPTSTPKNAAKLRVFTIGIPAAGALLFWALYSYNPSPRMQAVPLDAPGAQVSLPCKATSKTSTADSAFGVQSQTDFLCEADGVHYVVGYTDLPAQVVEPLVQAQATQRLMNEYIDNMLARTTGQLQARSTYHPHYGNYAIAVFAKPGWAARLQSWLLRFGRKAQTPQPTHVLQGKLHLQGQRMYMMSVLRPDPPSYNQELYAGRALQSFKVANNDKNGR